MLVMGSIIFLFIAAIASAFIIPNKSISDNEWDRKY